MNNLKSFQQHEKKALDLRSSIWISASAGGGKTTLIIKRILKLILFAIIDPKMFHVEHSKIIVLTYTNESANEIKNRVTKKLYDWQNNSQILEKDILFFTQDSDLTQCQFSRIKNECAQLFKKKTHMHLRISSFHSFCFQLIEKLQLINIKTSIVDDSQSKIILKKIINNHYINSNCSTWNILLNTKIYNKNKIENKMFHVEHFRKAKRNDIKNENSKLFHMEQFKENNIDTSNNSLNENVPCGTFYIEKKNINFFDEMKNHDLYKNYNKRHIRSNEPNVPCGTFSMRDQIKITNCSKWNNLKEHSILVNKIINITKSIFNSQIYYRDIRRIIKKYTEYKKKNHLLDFDDIIKKLHDKLNNSLNKEWIIYEINKQIEHLIIDEAQDNSDKQWGLVKKLTDDFLDENSQKTLFIVGDIKQSIYSFQGAKPQLFLETKHYFKQKFEIYKKSFTYIEWNFSFRVPQNTLNFIDSYFNQHQLTQNLMLEKIHSLNHIGFNQNTGVIIDINYNKKIKLKKISNVNKVNKLTFFKTKTNSLHCSTWNNVMNIKIDNKTNTQLFHMERCVGNEINNISRPNVQLFQMEQLEKYNVNTLNHSLNENVPHGTFAIRDKIKIQQCSTWNILKKQTLENLIYSKILQEIQNGTKESEIMILFRSKNKTTKNLVEILKRYKHKIYQKNNNIIKTSKTLEIIKLINIIVFDSKKTSSLNCSTWNNYRNTTNNISTNKKNKYYQQLDILLNQEVNIEQLIYQLKLIKKDLPYSILLLKIQSTLKKHLSEKIINKLFTITKNLEKQKIFSIKNFNLYLVNNPIDLEEYSHKDGIKMLTIHASKGLESKTVILINNILEKQFNSKNHQIMQSINDQLLIENQKESSRLLYVALTRTKEKLILINE